MDLSDRCIHEFAARDWRRGQNYYLHDAVTVQDHDATHVNAAVQGSTPRPYLVRLKWSPDDPKTLYVECDCPRFDTELSCKHIVATLLAADGLRPGLRIPGSGRVKVEASNDESDSDWWRDNARLDFGHNALPAGGLQELLRRRLVTRKRPRGAAARQKASPNVNWKTALASLTSAPFSQGKTQWRGPAGDWRHSQEYFYLLDLAISATHGKPCVSLYQRAINKNGSPGALKHADLYERNISQLPSEEDRAIVALLAGNERGFRQNNNDIHYTTNAYCSEFAIAPALYDVLLPRLCATGRFGWNVPSHDSNQTQFQPLTWDDGARWQLRLSVMRAHDNWQLRGSLDRGDESMHLNAPQALLKTGLLIFVNRMARWEAQHYEWAAALRQSGAIQIPVRQEVEFVERLAMAPALPVIELPVELQWNTVQPSPTPQLRISRPTNHWQSYDLHCDLKFQYREQVAAFGSAVPGWFDRPTRSFVRRDLAAELAARDLLLASGARRPRYLDVDAPEKLSVEPAQVPRLVRQLIEAGWQVEAEGRVIRAAGSMHVSIASSVDWFDLEAACDFGGQTVGLPKLLAALRRGERYVPLDDGTQGMLPEQWLAQFASLDELGHAEGNRIRFLPTQAALLDALLAAQDNQSVAVDKAFARVRDRLRSFQGVRPRQEPGTFVGVLRAYQREGLGWLNFLDEFGFGGCLADDMGLGKTIQILALLDQRRRSRKRPGPSLVVVPRSLVFNWLEEAKRFTPKLRVLDYTGLARGAARDSFDAQHLIVTTYGTLRRDIAQLREIPFDYAILDEAQAIKNSASQSAKACRLLRARRRLAMTGTPVENHLGELWSLFEFLNPGMLGRNPKLHSLFAVQRPSRDDDVATEERQADVSLLARAVRPYLLRRTKQQVLAELPDKTEQTLYCELSKSERELYNELRSHYRDTLLERIDRLGVNKSKMHVLEALLRLRQAACHPGLLDKKRIGAGSAKLESLLEQLEELGNEGHKALVFSQFTSLLAIVRQQLDRRKMDYEYLDGRTINRQAKVERFQNDPACRLFLISLKAGGHGLNLTAADYVFILDPWWNPAVEAQAVDRAHRMGQTRPVFAYRLIARDTVEEKILQLQEHKRGLADAIITADNSVLRNLTAEDLQLLLS